MSAPYVSSNIRAKADRLGFVVEIQTLTVRRPRGWPQKSARPVQLRRKVDHGHVASFADAFALLRYLQKKEA